MVLYMYETAICEDNPADIAYLSDILKKWAADTGNPLSIESYPSAEAFLFQYDENKAYDILFLDIEMGNISGMELAKKIREKNHTVQIIFITGYMEYIAEGYDVDALHYLLKPVTAIKLHSVLEKALQRLRHKEKALCLSIQSSMVRIPLHEIHYMEVRKNYVTIYAAEEYTVKKTLHELEQELNESFFRTGRSFIVNLCFVKKITKTQVFLKDNTAVPLSRNLYEEINRAIIRYF